jgi:hypothetical protein
MIAGVMLGLVADLIFDSVAARQRGYESEIDHYLAERGFVAARPAPRTRTR